MLDHRNLHFSQAQVPPWDLEPDRHESGCPRESDYLRELDYLLETKLARKAQKQNRNDHGGRPLRLHHRKMLAAAGVLQPVEQHAHHVADRDAYFEKASLTA